MSSQLALDFSHLYDIFHCTFSGIKIAEINVAEGRKQARVLNSEAYKSEQINQAFGEANAVIAKAEAKAKAITVIADSLGQKASTAVNLVLTKS